MCQSDINVVNATFNLLIDSSREYAKIKANRVQLEA